MSNRDEAAAGPSTSAEQDFIPSESFDGAKPGYVFKLDDCGVGYYRDIPLAERIQAASAEASKAAKSKPVVVKANNSLLKSLQKRGGGPQLSIPSGVKKQKKDDDESKPAYLKEMERYKSLSCGSDTKHDRPLVK
ncbi:hypothetical protein CHLRE_15g636500v5 [Chlamydomonas reinhardtii]|uniref:Uncharacterized protein n=1 Tax=Chlamydomonas reinhardtii TaxID=3055 RepID=A8JDX1_CHLRE|nr:uncharacterized protein CHLRE_15g636500v5 [Chlamydomonas reinhardtii]PNW72637.1 hypothetical protein CHLRE_15g636500v5 [Chlamydomonas reinhardtii]|eukprot:XP_001700633.1 predicted protein [Chlamydomonas reinhardtii]